MSNEQHPLAAYRARLEDRKRALDLLRRRDVWCSNARLAVFILGLVTVWLSVVQSALPIFALAIPLVAFLLLVLAHERILRTQNVAEGAVKYYQQGIERIEDRWAGRGRGGEELAPGNHLYAEDLDVFGEGSLFELLCTARTRSGEGTLAHWLCTPAAKEEIDARQEAVAELRGELDFRETLALLGGSARARVRPEVLADWATAAPVLTKGLPYWLAIALVALSVAAFVGWAADIWSLSPFILVVAAELIFARSMKEEVIRVISALDEPMKDLTVFSKVVRHFETAALETHKLRELQQRLTAFDIKASARIAQLARLVTWLDAHRNQMFAPVALVLLWTVHFAYALERWRERCGTKVPDWLGAMGGGN